MKKISLALTLSILSQNAFATALPSYLADKLDQANSDSSLQMVVYDSVNKVASSKNYVDEVKKQVVRDLGGWERALDASAISGLGAAMGGMVTLIISHALDQSNASASAGIRGEGYLSLGAGLFVGGALLGGGAVALATKEKREFLLNESKGDHFAGAVAKSMAHFFQLSKQKEDAIKFAMKDEIHRRAKAKDYSDLDVMAVVKGAKQGEKSVLTDAQKLQIDLISQKLKEMNEKVKEKKELPTLAQDDKIRLLAAQKAILQTHSDLIREDSKAGAAMRAQVAANERLLSEIKQFKLSQGDKVEESDKAEGTGAAE